MCLSVRTLCFRINVFRDYSLVKNCFISFQATAVCSPRKESLVFISMKLHLWFSFPCIGVWNTLFHINTPFGNRAEVWCIHRADPVECCLNDFVFELVAPRETNYRVIGDLAELCSRSSVRSSFFQRGTAAPPCDVWSGNGAGLINQNSLKHQRGDQIRQVRTETSKLSGKQQTFI